MTLSPRHFLPGAVVVALLAVAACGKSASPTSPGGTQPTIARITPNSPLASGTAQTLSVLGENFSSGLTLFLRSPSGAPSTYGPGTLSSQTSTSFSVAATLDAAGSWTASVRNVDGSESSGFQFAVVAAGASDPPTIASVVPAVLVAGPSAQQISIAGANFRAGASVIVQDSTGISVNGVSVSSLSDTTITANVAFTASGSYSIRVHNADGTESSPLTVTVNPA